MKINIIIFGLIVFVGCKLNETKTSKIEIDKNEYFYFNNTSYKFEKPWVMLHNEEDSIMKILEFQNMLSDKNERVILSKVNLKNYDKDEYSRLIFVDMPEVLGTDTLFGLNFDFQIYRDNNMNNFTYRRIFYKEINDSVGLMINHSLEGRTDFKPIFSNLNKTFKRPPQTD